MSDHSLASIKHPLSYLDASALTHSLVKPTTVLVLGATMIFTLLAALLEGLYFGQQEFVSNIEWAALILTGIGLTGVLGLLATYKGKYTDLIALSVFTGAIFYIFTMLISALFWNADVTRSLHTVLWFHPAFIAVTLTQPAKTAQRACWLVIVLLSGIIIFFGVKNDIGILGSTMLANHYLIILSLCASAALLYGLSVYRENIGADRARIEVLQETETMLRKEVQEKELALAGLAQANAVVASFLNNMSHELRTPLNAIIGFSELIHGEMFGALANERYKEYAGDILGSGQSLLELVNNLLFFSKLTAGNITLVPDPLNVRDIIEQVASNQCAKAESAEVSIITDVAGQPMFEADPNAVTRILNSLLDNAIKFSHAGGKIYLQAAQQAHGACEISVRDTGIGIASAELEEILAPFRKSADSETQAVPGAGLGLTTAKMLMELLGGTLSIDSKPGAGTCVTLVFYPQAQSGALAQTG